MKINLTICLVLMLATVQCKKVANNRIAKVYVFSESVVENSIYVYPSADEGILVVGSRYNVGHIDITLTKFSKDGGREWNREITGVGGYVVAGVDNAGGVIMIANATPHSFIRIDNKGNVVFNKSFIPTGSNGFSVPVIGDDGNYYSMLNKSVSWAEDTNTVIQFDPNGNFLPDKKFNIPNSAFNGAIYLMKIFKKKATDYYYFYGLIYKTPVNFWDNPRLFVSRIEYSGNAVKSKKTVLLDPTNNLLTNYPEFECAVGSDNSVVILHRQQTPAGVSYSKLTKVNENLEKVWETELKIGQGNTVPKSIRIGKDGDYLVCGYCNVVGKNAQQPFSALVSPAGKLLKTRIFSSTGSGYFNSGYQQNNGNFVLSGSTNGFGKSINKQDLLLVQTDAALK